MCIRDSPQTAPLPARDVIFYFHFLVLVRERGRDEGVVVTGDVRRRNRHRDGIGDGRLVGEAEAALTDLDHETTDLVRRPPGPAQEHVPEEPTGAQVDRDEPERHETLVPCLLYTSSSSDC